MQLGLEMRQKLLADTEQSVFFCPAEILSHVILWHQCSCCIDKRRQGETDAAQF